MCFKERKYVCNEVARKKGRYSIYALDPLKLVPPYKEEVSEAKVCTTVVSHEDRENNND